MSAIGGTSRVADTLKKQHPQPHRLREMVADALAFGGRVANDGGGISHGSFFYPAIVFPVDARMPLWRVEQFGPVIPVIPFNDLEEPIRYVAAKGTEAN